MEEDALETLKDDEEVLLEIAGAPPATAVLLEAAAGTGKADEILLVTGEPLEAGAGGGEIVGTAAGGLPADVD